MTTSRKTTTTPMDKGSFSSSKGDSADFEAEVSLSDRLKVFKSSQFDPDAYLTNRCRAMSEKELRHLCIYLIDLKKASAEEMRKSVYANYSAFIRTSREISLLEGQLLSLRNLLSTRAALVQGLSEGIRVDNLSDGPEGKRKDDIVDVEIKEPSKMEIWLAQFKETLEVLLAERRVEEALAALNEGELMAVKAEERKTLAPLALTSLRNTIIEKRQNLSDQLAETAFQPSIRGIELRSAVQALKQLGDAPRAHTLLLQCHHHKIQKQMQCLRPSGSNGIAYTASLSQMVFSIIAQAASHSLAIFDEESAYASELVTWAANQTENFALVIKRHVIASPAASGSLRPVTECVHVSLGHCSLLEEQGLALSPVLLRIFKPFIEQALNANLKRIEQCTAALAVADDWSLTYKPLGMRSTSTASLASAPTSQPRMSSSAHRFNTMVQELCDDIGPLESRQYSEQALGGIIQAFNSYINMMINALPGSEEIENLEESGSRIVRTAATEAQQLALLANAVLLADELLPRAASKLSLWTNNDLSRKHKQIHPEKELKRKLQRLVEQLRDSFCRQHALDLLFNEDGGTKLNADMYISMDDSEVEPDWFPSPVFQELFDKLTLIASIAAEVFVGRERFATILLMRLTETIILWLSDDQTFWEAIEEGPIALGPFGLQQFWLDMEFVTFFSAKGRYLSRNLKQVIETLQGRVIEAVAATIKDPYSVLPEDDWFQDVSQIAVKMLTERMETNSPTASVSARSVSSVHSHGSN